MEINGVLDLNYHCKGYTLPRARTWADEINFGMNRAPCTGSITIHVQARNPWMSRASSIDIKNLLIFHAGIPDFKPLPLASPLTKPKMSILSDLPLPKLGFVRVMPVSGLPFQALSLSNCTGH